MTLRPGVRPYKTSLGDGIHVIVNPSGSKLYRWSYRFGGAQNALALGVVGSVPLAEVRRQVAEYKLMLLAGKNPAEERRRASLPQIGATPPPLRRKKTRPQLTDEGDIIVGSGPGLAFRTVAKEWYDTRKRTALDARYGALVWTRLRNDVLPAIGQLPISEIRPRDIIAMLRRIEERGAIETARRVRGSVSEIFRYGVAMEYCERDPARDVSDALAPAPRRSHLAALDFAELPDFFMALATKPERTAKTTLALKFTAHTAVRTGEARFAEWKEIKENVWYIPAEKMKMDRPHIVPLSKQVLQLLPKIKKESADSPYLFPEDTSSGVISDRRMIKLIYDVGYKGRMTVHGFRSIFSSHANESGLFHADAIELQLAHIDLNAVRAAYNRAQRLDERRKLMDWWSNELSAQEELADMI